MGRAIPGRIDPMNRGGPAWRTMAVLGVLGGRHHRHTAARTRGIGAGRDRYGPEISADTGRT